MIRKAARLLPSTKIGEIIRGRGPWGHAWKRCPCMRCYKRRTEFYSPMLCSEIQEKIKLELYENIQISREMERYI